MKPTNESKNNKNLLSNTSFEASENGVPKNWTAYKGWDGGYISISTDNPHSGDYCLKIEFPEGATGVSPWAMQSVLNIAEGEEYIVGGFLMANNIKTGKQRPVFKIEFMDDDGRNVDYTESEVFQDTLGVWMNVSTTFTVPYGLGITSMNIFYRMEGNVTGQIYFDDVYCMRLADPKKMNFETEEVFYYTESEVGKAVATVNFERYPELKDTCYIEFAISSDGNEVMQKDVKPQCDGKAIFTFDVMTLADIGKEYTVEARLHETAEADASEVYSKAIYRYDRPTAIDENGFFIKANGDKLRPIFAYHVTLAQLPLVPQSGVNLVQSMGSQLDIEKLRNYMDVAHANNVMVLASLYGGMVVAGRDDNAEASRACVEELKDHPALFGWMVMDEPFIHYADADECRDDLRKSYKLIRDIDPHHPVYIVEANHGKYLDSSKYCDILAVDRYPIGVAPISEVANYVYDAIEVTNGRRPIWGLHQTYPKVDGRLPTLDEVRNMSYGVLFSGGKSFGYYSFTEWGDKPFDILQSKLWRELCTFTGDEVEWMFDAFVENKYPMLNSNREGDVWYRSYIVDGEIYTVVLNQTEETVKADIPLSSDIDGFTGTLLWGIGEESVSGNATLALTLTPHQAVVYKLTPKSALDGTSLSK